jgi:hypothetical protein
MLNSAGDSIRESTAAMDDSVRDGATAVGDMVARGRDAAGRAGNYTYGAASDLNAVLADNPLLLGALGISAGALLGALAVEQLLHSKAGTTAFMSALRRSGLHWCSDRYWSRKCAHQDGLQRRRTRLWRVRHLADEIEPDLFAAMVEQMPDGRCNVGSRRDVVLVGCGPDALQQSIIGDGGKEFFGRRGIRQAAQNVAEHRRPLLNEGRRSARDVAAADPCLTRQQRHVLCSRATR